MTKTPAEALCEHEHGPFRWEQLTNGAKNSYVKRAAAVIAAARPQIEAEARAETVQTVIGKLYDLADDMNSVNIDDHLATLEALAALPPTHQVVPVEPTKEMLGAAEDVMNVEELQFFVEDIIAIYKAMLAASKGES